MLWPTGSPYVFTVPEEAPIVDSCSLYRNGPYSVISLSSIYVFEPRTNTMVNYHLRSSESIEAYGDNLRIKSNGVDIFIVQTDKNYLLLYSIGGHSDGEILSIYDKSHPNKFLQNGFPTTSSKIGFLNSIFGKSGVQSPNKDLLLRFKVVLKIQSALVDFINLLHDKLLLITKNPKLLQLIHLGDSHNNSNIEVTLVDELDWFQNDLSDIVKIQYVDNKLYWSTLQNIWQIDIKQLQLTSFKGSIIFKGRCKNFLVNSTYNLLTVIRDNDDMEIYQLNTQKLISVNRKSRSNKSHTLLDMRYSPCESCLMMLYDSEWCLYTAFGNLNFATFDYKDDKFEIFNKMEEMSWIANDSLLMSMNSKIYVFQLTSINFKLHQNLLNLYRPILIHNGYISVFKGYEKPLNDYSSHSDLLNNKEFELWYHIQLPTNFKLKNDFIVSVTSSKCGNYICCVGNRDLIIYNNDTRQWKFLIIDYNQHSDIENNIVDCLWFENYLILLVKKNFNDFLQHEELKPTSGLLIFSNLIWNDDLEFNPELCIWNFPFNNEILLNKQNEPLPRSKPVEDFLYFNIYNNELIVLTTDYNCYFFEITKKVKNKKKTLQIKCLKVFALKNFLKTYPQTSIKSINKINENDLLILINGEVIYLRQSVIEEDIASHSNISSTADLARIKSSASLSSLPQHKSNTSISSLLQISEAKPPPSPRHEHKRKRPSIRFEKIVLMNGVEILNKLEDTISMFDGNEMIIYDLKLSHSKLMKSNISRIEPLRINLDDNVIKSGDIKVMEQNHSSIYPFITILSQNVIIGFEIDLKFEKTWNYVFMKSKRRDFLNNLLDYHLQHDNYKINEIYSKFHVFKNYQFCLEVLIFNYLTSEAEDNVKFQKLIELIKVSTSSEYMIYLSLLKKIETNYWVKFFEKLGETPRAILLDKILPSGNYKLSCHYLILTMNYERELNESNLDERDQELVLMILNKLFEENEFDTCFELVRFVKLIDQENKFKLIDQFLKQSGRE